MSPVLFRRKLTRYLHTYTADKVDMLTRSSVHMNVLADWWCSAGRRWINPEHFLPRVRGLSPGQGRETRFSACSPESKPSECPDAKTVDIRFLNQAKIIYIKVMVQNSTNIRNIQAIYTSNRNLTMSPTNSLLFFQRRQFFK